MFQRIIEIIVIELLSLCLISFSPVPITVGSANFETGGIILESEVNDNFTVADPLSPDSVVNGTTGMLAMNPIDVFTFQAKMGQAISVTMYTNSSGYNEKAVHLDLYDKFKNDHIAWSHSGYPCESLTSLAKFDDSYYIVITPWRGLFISYSMFVNVTEPPRVDDGLIISGSVSNNSDNPTDWYKMALAGGQTTNDVGNATLSFDSDEVRFGLSARTFSGIGGSWPYYYPWWKYYYGTWWDYYYGTVNSGIEDIEWAAAFSGDYFLDVHAWKGTGPYTLTVKRKSAPSDGDNTPQSATLISEKPGQTKANYTGGLDSTYDYFDWYKIHLREGRGITATVRLLDPWNPALYWISLLRWNTTSNSYDVRSSSTNIKDPNIVTGQAQAFISSIPTGDDYYICLMATQVILHPSNRSNLADWQMAQGHARYQLIVDSPQDGSHTRNLLQSTPTVKKIYEPIQKISNSAHLVQNITNTNNATIDMGISETTHLEKEMETAEGGTGTNDPRVLTKESMDDKSPDELPDDNSTDLTKVSENPKPSPITRINATQNGTIIENSSSRTLMKFASIRPFCETMSVFYLSFVVFICILVRKR